jgi:Family of unknown function (DUF6113)
VTEPAAGRPTFSPGSASVTGSEPPRPDVHPAVTAGAYIALCLLGMVQGLIGTFQYSRGPGVLVAILFDAAILATCMLGARGMRTALGGLLPAVGWFVVTLVLSANSAGGSVIVTDTAAGKWFLYGGSLCAAAGAVYAFARWSKGSREHRARGRG